MRIPDNLAIALAATGNAAPFFQFYLYDRLNIVVIHPDDPMGARIRTAATDGKALYLNAEFMGGLPIEEAVGVICHEVNHDMLGHPFKMREWVRTLEVHSADGSQMRPFSHELMNIAMDAEINAALRASGFSLPKEGVDIPWVKPREFVVEDVYIRLYDEMKAAGKLKEISHGGQPGDEEGEGGGAGEGEGEAPSGGGKIVDGGDAKKGRGGHMAAGHDETPLDKENRRASVASAAAHGKRAGKMPGAYKALIDEIMEPQVPWTDVLRDIVVASVGADMMDWHKMHRRQFMMLNVFAPRRKAERCGHIAFITDTSGSCHGLYGQFFGEMAAVAETLQPMGMHIIWTDYVVAGVDQFDASDDYGAEDIARLQLKGGGGTDLRRGFEWVQEHLLGMGEQVDAIVVLTDSETPWPSDEECAAFACPIICATSGPGLSHPSVFTVVGIDEEKKARGR